MSRTPWPPPAAIGVGSDYAPGESENPYHRLCFGDREPLEDDFKRLAVAVFQPLFEHGREIPG